MLKTPSKSLWKAKGKAFAVHFFFTGLVAAAAAMLVFRLWFPKPFADMMGGTDLFVLVVGCDLILGPLISLVIYNPAKRRRDLLMDYGVVVLVQLSALGYGLHTVAQARPAFLVFAVDRYEVVSAGELAPADLAKIHNPALLRQLPWTGYHTVYVHMPKDADASFDLIMSALSGGKDLRNLTENYQPVAEHVAEINQAAQPLAACRKRIPDAGAALDAAIQSTGLPASRLRCLPVQAPAKGGSAFWTALIDSRTALPVAWIDADPF